METNENSKEQAMRFNIGKTEWSLIDFDSIEDLAKVLKMGADKYSRNNWRKGMPITKICDSLFRHLISFMQGEDLDSESGLNHMGHIMANAMFITYMLKYRPELDDRYSNPSKQSKL